MKINVLALGATALLALTACSGANSQEHSSAAHEASASASASLSPQPSACDREASAATDIAQAPEVEEWKTWGTAVYPVSSLYGAEKTGSNGAPSCFAHSPEGALFASATYSGAILSPAEFEKVIRDHLQPADQAQVFLDSWNSAAGEAYSTVADTKFTIQGYKLVSYDSDHAVISIALGVDGVTDRYMAITLPLVWADNDWQINATDTADYEFYAQSGDLLTSLEGYTIWNPKDAP